MSLPRLSSDEINLLELILEFYQNASIAKELNCMTQDVNEKITKLLALFNCRTKTELIIKCGRESLHFTNEDGANEQRLYFIGSGTDSH
jgi:DNA-binding NarL/FixJ family response regulator